MNSASCARTGPGVARDPSRTLSGSCRSAWVSSRSCSCSRRRAAAFTSSRGRSPQRRARGPSRRARSPRAGCVGFLELGLAEPLSEWPLRRWDLRSSSRWRRCTSGRAWPSRALRRRSPARGVRTAGARPNPTLSVTPEIASNAAKGVNPWLAAIQLDWPVETAGKRERRIERAAAAAQSTRLGVWSEVWRIRQQLQAAVIELAGARRRLASLQLDVEETGHLLRLLEDRVARGAASASRAGPRAADADPRRRGAGGERGVGGASARASCGSARRPRRPRARGSR